MPKQSSLRSGRLAGCTDPSSLEPLQQALESDQSEVVMTAARALGLRGEESCSSRVVPVAIDR